jgi:hypothetical protein
MLFSTDLLELNAKKQMFRGRRRLIETDYAGRVGQLRDRQPIDKVERPLQFVNLSIWRSEFEMESAAGQEGESDKTRHSGPDAEGGGFTGE